MKHVMFFKNLLQHIKTKNFELIVGKTETHFLAVTFYVNLFRLKVSDNYTLAEFDR